LPVIVGLRAYMLVYSEWFQVDIDCVLVSMAGPEVLEIRVDGYPALKSYVADGPIVAFHQAQVGLRVRHLTK